MQRSLLAVAGAIACVFAGTATAGAATFNGGGVTIPSSGIGNPYPSTITVSGLTGTITKVTASLTLTHTFPDDVAVLLVGPAGQKVMLMADSGGNPDLTNVVLTFDDAAASSLPNNGNIAAGTYKPTTGTTGGGQGNAVPANLPAPAPAGPYGSLLGAFNGTAPNGTWSLFVLDDTDVDAGSISSWSLNITTAAAADTTAPTLTSGFAGQSGVSGPVSVSGVPTYGGPVVVTFNAADAGSGVVGISCLVDGGTPAGAQFSFAATASTTKTLTFGDAGKHTYSCKAVDAAGNQSAPPTTGTFAIDTGAPTTGAVASPGGVNNGPISVTVSASDPQIGSGVTLAPGSGVASVRTSVNGAPPVTTAGASTTLTFTNSGTYTVTYSAKDNLGNTAPNKTITVVVDTVKPNASYDGASSRSVSRSSGSFDSDAGDAFLSGTASDNRGVTGVQVRFVSTSDVVFDETYAASCPSCGPTSTPVSWSLNLSKLSPAPPVGIYATQIIARDQAGNTRVVAGPTVRFAP